MLVVRRSSKPPWLTYSTSWATPAVGSSSWTPSARVVTNLFVLVEELGASRQAEQPAACRRAGILRVSGSGRMPCVPCVLSRPGTLCSMLACVSAGVVCHCLCVSSDGVFAVPVVCDRKRAGAAMRCCAWSPRHCSHPRSWWGGSCAQWARGVTWGGRIASRLCATRVRVRTASREKNRGHVCPKVRVNVSGWYECFRIVLNLSVCRLSGRWRALGRPFSRKRR